MDSENETEENESTRTVPTDSNTLEDDGVRAPLAATPTAFKAEITFATDDLTAESKSFVISFSEPVNPNEFGIAMDFAENWTLDWAEDKTAVTVNFDGALASGQEGSVIIFRLRDAENNMIGQNGIAGPVANQFTVK